MNIFENAEIRCRLRSAFPKLFINSRFELIIHPRRNSYVMLEGVETERHLNAKILEWLSREALKGGSRQSQKYHFDGINKFLQTDFTREEIELIYTYLGNGCDHEKTLRFIDSGYDMSVLEPKEENDG